MRIGLLLVFIGAIGCKKPATLSGPPAAHALDRVLDGLGSTDVKTAQKAVRELAKMLNENSLTAAVVEPRTARVVAPLRAGLTRAAALQQDDPPTCGSWATKEPFEIVRYPLELLLDLAGLASAAGVEQELRKGLALKDPQLRWFAARSLLRLDRTVDGATIASIAESDVVRGRLFETLSERGSVNLVPAQLRTQEALARANLVDWLMYPTELGCEPNEIELVKVVPVGDDDHYVFRFRTDAAMVGQPAKTWLLGAAGPYKRGPVTAHANGTFSTFARAEDKTAEQYVADMRAVVDNANKNIDPKSKTAPILPGK